MTTPADGHKLESSAGTLGQAVAESAAVALLSDTWTGGPGQSPLQTSEPLGLMMKASSILDSKVTPSTIDSINNQPGIHNLNRGGINNVLPDKESKTNGSIGPEGAGNTNGVIPRIAKLFGDVSGVAESMGRGITDGLSLGLVIPPIQGLIGGKLGNVITNNDNVQTKSNLSNERKLQPEQPRGVRDPLGSPRYRRSLGD